MREIGWGLYCYYIIFFYIDRILTLTVVVSNPNSLKSFKVYAPASVSFTPLITRVVTSWEVSICNRPLSSLLDSVFPECDHSMQGVGSPVKAQATVRTFPDSILISWGAASIFGGIPGERTNKLICYYADIAQPILGLLNCKCFLAKMHRLSISPLRPWEIALMDDPSTCERLDIAIILLELIAIILSEVMEVMLDADMLSNLTSAMLELLKDVSCIFETSCLAE